MSPSKLHQPAVDADRLQRLRVAVVESDGANAPLASLFVGCDDVMIVMSTTVAGLLDLVDDGQIDAILLDPELSEGWPTTVAEKIVDGVNDRVPLLIVCRSDSDAKVIGDRLASAYVSVTQRKGLSPSAALQFFAGVTLTKRPKPFGQ